MSPAIVTLVELVVGYQLLNASDLPLDCIISSYVANTTEARLLRRRQAV